MPAAAQTYKKIVVRADRFGSRDFAEATRIVSVPLAAPAAGELLVRVAAAGVEASDVLQMAGGYGALSGRRPAARHDGTVQVGDLGCEGVGVVAAVGDGVDTEEWPVGQPVAWYGYGVSFREYVHLKARPGPGDSQSLIKVPTAAAEWTALPVSALTAVGGLELAGGIARGDAVLVTGAAGGTGHVAVQWAKKVWGCRVAGTCGSAEKEEMLRALGCDVVVNYRTQDAEAALRAAFPAGFDLVYEGVGGRVGNTARRLLAPAGTLVSIGAVANDYSGATHGDADGPPPAPLRTQRITGFFMPQGAQHARWAELVAATVDAVATGKVRVVLDPGCAGFRGVEGIYRAQARMRTGANAGKIYAVLAGA